jgi:RHS repeat-associated protein
MTYDSEGLLVEIRQGSGSAARVTTMDYDAFGRLSSVLDPIGRTTGFAYDPANRLTTRTLPDAAVVAMDYDANGNMIALTPPARPAHEFDYTPVNLESSYDPPNVGLAGDVTHQYYDLDRMLTQVDRPDGTLQYGYDAAGRLAAVTAPTHTVTYGYDVDTGQLVTVSSTGGIDLDFTYDGFLRTSSTWSGLVAGSVSQTYDNSFRPIAETIEGAGSPQAISFGWDDDDLLIAAGPVALSRRASDGLLASATVGAAVETYGYNAFGETTSRQSAWSGGTMYAATYTRDDLGRIATKTETVQGVTTTHAYGYDARGRLATVHTNGTLTATWGYDANGNRVVQTTPAATTVGLVDDQDRLLAWGAASYTYDANGDLTTRTDSAGLTSYDYDLFGNLRRVDLPGGDVVEYLVDGQNRRVGRALNGAVTHKWLYKDQLNPVAELDAAGNVVARFIYGTTYHAPDVMLKGGVTYRLITDHLGSVRLVVDVATGSVAQRLDYDEWGRVLVDTNPGFQPFGYAGGLYDSATGLVRFGARDYDAEVGRWTAKDPIRFAGGDENIYAYVGGDPVNLVDPGGYEAQMCSDDGNDYEPKNCETGSESGCKVWCYSEKCYLVAQRKPLKKATCYEKCTRGCERRCEGGANDI